jgi:hypothetical protein
MAAELEGDLRAAAEKGVPAESYVGFDPRAFAPRGRPNEVWCGRVRASRRRRSPRCSAPSPAFAVVMADVVVAAGVFAVVVASVRLHALSGRGRAPRTLTE